jgi:hypothetical protein
LRLSKVLKSYKNSGIFQAFLCPTLPFSALGETAWHRQIGARQPAQKRRPLDAPADLTDEQKAPGHRGVTGILASICLLRLLGSAPSITTVPVPRRLP